MPAERSAASDNLADRIRRVPPLRAANGARARRAAFRTSGLFRRGCSQRTGRILKTGAREVHWNTVIGTLPSRRVIVITTSLRGVATTHQPGTARRETPALPSIKRDRVPILIEAETETGLHQNEYQGARPGSWPACDPTEKHDHREKTESASLGSYCEISWCLERTGAGGTKPAQESVGVGIRVEVLHHALPPGQPHPPRQLR